PWAKLIDLRKCVPAAADGGQATRNCRLTQPASLHRHGAARSREVAMKRSLLGLLAAGAALTFTMAQPAAAQEKTIRIGVNTAIQLQVGRDAIDAVRMAIDEVNGKGGVLGRKLEMIVADEGEAATEGPKVGIAAVNKLTGEDKVDVLIGGYDSGVTLGEVPQITRATSTCSASTRSTQPSSPPRSSTSSPGS